MSVQNVKVDEILPRNNTSEFQLSTGQISKQKIAITRNLDRAMT